MPARGRATILGRLFGAIFNAADLIPSIIGSVTESGAPGAFYQAMLDYVDHGPENLDQILADTEAAWP